MILAPIGPVIICSVVIHSLLSLMIFWTKKNETPLPSGLHASNKSSSTRVTGIILHAFGFLGLLIGEVAQIFVAR